ncbi:hypothetical protein VCV18_003930 [Metarhizium anisopliae]
MTEEPARAQSVERTNQVIIPTNQLTSTIHLRPPRPGSGLALMGKPTGLSFFVEQIRPNCPTTTDSPSNPSFYNLLVYLFPGRLLLQFLYPVSA